MVYITTSWEPALDGLADCPMSSVELWIPRAIARGYTEQRLVYSPEALNGAGGYLAPTPVLKENRPLLSIAVNATDPASWSVPLLYDVDVALPPDLAFSVRGPGLLPGTPLYSFARAVALKMVQDSSLGPPFLSPVLLWL